MANFESWINILILVYSVSKPQGIRAKNCVKKDACQCVFDDGSGTVDLSSLGLSSGEPLIKDQDAPDGFQYSFNPCYSFNEGSCFNAAGCQLDVNNILYYNIGDSMKVEWGFDGANVVGTYTADDDARTSTVTYVCDPSATSPSWQVNGEDPPGQPTYTFVITSSEACPKGAPPASSTDGPSPTDGPSGTVSVSISTGTIISIVVLSIALVYIVAGVLFNKLYRKETGKNTIPNITFWSVLPGLIKDGFGFTYAKIRRREYQAI